jgi:hypothetical protein
MFLLIICIVGLALPWWLFIPLAVVYGLLYKVEELLLVGLFLDLLVGNPVPWLPLPLVYTSSLVGLYVFLWGIKPLLTFYETREHF